MILRFSRLNAQCILFLLLFSSAWTSLLPKESAFAKYLDYLLPFPLLTRDTLTSTSGEATNECPKNDKSFPFKSSVLLERARRCMDDNPFNCESVAVKQEYNMFGDYDFSDLVQTELFLTQYNTPQKESTENVIFIVAGQQAGAGGRSGLTGQKAQFKNGFKRSSKSRIRSIASDSLIKKLLDSKYFSSENTYVGLVFDARYNFEFLGNKKDIIVQGYYDYLMQKLGENIGTIYLAGHSRGGCLVMRLASRITSNFPNARVIVHNYDGVCASGALLPSEFDVGFPIRKSPVLDGAKVYTTQMETQYQNTKCLAIRSFLSGAEIGLPLGLGNIIRAFGHDGFYFTEKQKNRLMTDDGYPWYEESFHPLGHSPIANSEFIHSLAATHLETAMKGLPCSCGA